MTVRTLLTTALAALMLTPFMTTQAQDTPSSGYYEEDVKASNPLRAEQAGEIGCNTRILQPGYLRMVCPQLVRILSMDSP